MFVLIAANPTITHVHPHACSANRSIAIKSPCICLPSTADTTLGRVYRTCSYIVPRHSFPGHVFNTSQLCLKIRRNLPLPCLPVSPPAMPPMTLVSMELMSRFTMGRYVYRMLSYRQNCTASKGRSLSMNAQYPEYSPPMRSFAKMDVTWERSRTCCSLCWNDWNQGTRDRLFIETWYCGFERSWKQGHVILWSVTRETIYWTEAEGLQYSKVIWGWRAGAWNLGKLKLLCNTVRPCGAA